MGTTHVFSFWANEITQFHGMKVLIMLRAATISFILCYVTFLFETLSSAVVAPNTTAVDIPPHSIPIEKELYEHSNATDTALKKFINFAKSRHKKPTNMSEEGHKKSSELHYNFDIGNGTKKKAKHSTRINSSLPILYKIHSTLTRSKDAVWATVALTFICILLLLAVAQSGMWKNYHGSEAQGVPLPNFNERVPFQDVMKHKMMFLKEFMRKGRKNKKNKDNKEVELESLLAGCDVDDDEDNYDDTFRS